MDSDNLEKLIIQSFKKLITNSSVDPSCLELLSDEVVNSYVINTVKQLYEENENKSIWADSNIVELFDVDTFVEIIDAYFEGFQDIDKKELVSWLVQLKQEMESLLVKQKQPNKLEGEIVKATEALSMEETITTVHQDSKMEAKTATNPEVLSLIEMFPLLSLKTVSKVYKKHGSDYNRCLESLLMSYESLVDDGSDDEKKVRYISKYDLTEEERQKIKEETVKRYGLIKVSDGTEETKSPLTHSKPLWDSDKKLIRYYDSKVVTTKGEKKFFYKTEEDLEKEKEMKKTYINLKPARAYRFH